MDGKSWFSYIKNFFSSRNKSKSREERLKIHARCQRRFFLIKNPKYLRETRDVKSYFFECSPLKLKVGAIETEWTIVVYLKEAKRINYFSVYVKRKSEAGDSIEIRGEVTLRKANSVCCFQPLMRTQLMSDSNRISSVLISHHDFMRKFEPLPTKLEVRVDFDIFTRRESLLSKQRLSIVQSDKSINGLLSEMPVDDDKAQNDPKNICYAKYLVNSS